MTYDSTAETQKHILRVSELLHQVVRDLLDRADKHDRSKLIEPEKTIFDEYTPKLETSTYGSEEYKSYLTGMGEALKHHYQHNKSHHPDAHTNGLLDMNLLDLIEMLIDHKAATERHATGNIWKSIELNRKRFGMSDDLVKIFQNTVNYLNLGEAVSLIIEAPIGNDKFILMENDFIKHLETRYGIRYIANNCLPMYEKTLEEFKTNCLLGVSNVCQYYFTCYKSIPDAQELASEISSYLKCNGYSIYYLVWINYKQ